MRRLLATSNGHGALVGPFTFPCLPSTCRVVDDDDIRVLLAKGKRGAYAVGRPRVIAHSDGHATQPTRDPTTTIA
jgi:hypothetical protein